MKLPWQKVKETDNQTMTIEHSKATERLRKKVNGKFDQSIFIVIFYVRLGIVIFDKLSDF